ncbi:DUF4237 domain-containing protein, partial [Listeria seeligeri]
AAKTIQAKAKEAFQMPPRERLAFAGVGDDISGQTATGTISAAQKKLRDMMSKMGDLNIKGSGTGDIIEGNVDSIGIPENMQKWNYPPTEELYKKYEKVYTNPMYYDQVTGDIKWPPNNGFVSEPHDRITDVGEVFDRYGEPNGEFLAKVGSSFEDRALAPHSESANYYRYRVGKPFKIIEGETAPWFGQKGGATQLYGITEDGTILSVEQLVDEEYLELLN